LSHAGDAPVLYIDSARYLKVDGTTVPMMIENAVVNQPIYVWRNSTTFAPKTAAPVRLSIDANQAVFHPDSFQLISAGRDREFYTDDDISNMWPGTWGDWKTSKKLN